MPDTDILGLLERWQQTQNPDDWSRFTEAMIGQAQRPQTDVAPAAILDPRSNISRQLFDRRNDPARPAETRGDRTQSLMRTLLDPGTLDRSGPTEEDKALLRAGGTLPGGTLSTGRHPRSAGQRLDVSPEHSTITRGGRIQHDAPPPPMPRTNSNLHHPGTRAIGGGSPQWSSDAEALQQRAYSGDDELLGGEGEFAHLFEPKSLAQALQARGRPSTPSQSFRPLHIWPGSDFISEGSDTSPPGPSPARQRMDQLRELRRVGRDADKEFAHLTERDPEAESADMGIAMEDRRRRERTKIAYDRLQETPLPQDGGTDPLAGDRSYIDRLMESNPETRAYAEGGGHQGEIDSIRAKARRRVVSNRPLSQGGGLYGVLADPATRAARDRVMKVDLGDGRSATRMRPGSNTGVVDGRHVDLTPRRVPAEVQRKRDLRAASGKAAPGYGRQTVSSKDYMRMQANYGLQYEARDKTKEGAKEQTFSQWVKERRRSGTRHVSNVRDAERNAYNAARAGSPVGKVKKTKGMSEDKHNALRRASNRGEERGRRKRALEEPRRKEQYLRRGKQPPGDMDTGSSAAPAVPGVPAAPGAPAADGKGIMIPGSTPAVP